MESFGQRACRGTFTRALVALCLTSAASCETPDGFEQPSSPPSVLERAPAALSGDNLAGNNLGGVNLGGVNLGGVNLGGANLGGVNLGGSNLAGNNLGGTNLGGNNLGGVNLGGSNLGGVNLGGVNLGGVNLGGVNLGGSNLGGSNLGGSNLAGNNLGGTNLGGTNLGGVNTGSNIHNLAASVNGMLYSGEDLWSTVTDRCVVMGIGSTAFAKLLGQQSANANIYVALGRLPWGFSNNSGAPVALTAWEAVVWGNNTYCSFVLATPNDASWAGVAGFVKAVFRWQAPPTQTMYISGIEASAPVDPTLSTSTYSYTGMMNAAGQWRLGKITDRNFVAGELAFVAATTNNQSVMVDFASWVMDSTSTGLILGNVESLNPPTRAESVYYVVDNGDGSVSVKIAAAASGLTTVSDTFEALNAAWASYQDSSVAKPIPRRCGGALYLNYYYGEPMPAGKCDDGLTWGNASSASGSRKWSTVSGTTAPMSSYMLLPLNASTPLMRGVTADDLKPVLSETYVHTWDAASDLATGLTVIDDAVTGTGLNQFNYVGDDADTWGHSTTSEENYKDTNSYEGAANQYATFTFQGTQIQLYFVKDPIHGIAAVSIDGGPETLVDLYNASRRGYQLGWAASNLFPGVNHTVKIRVTGTKNPKATATHVAIDAAVISNAATCVYEPDASFCARQGKTCGSVTAIDNCGAVRTVPFCGSCTAPQTCGGSGEDNVCGNGTVVDDKVTGTGAAQFNYSSSGWSSCYRCGNGSLYNSSNSVSKTAGGVMTFAFNGMKIRLYGTKSPNHGIGAVSIDNGPETSVDFYNATYIGDQLVWTSPTLAAGSHTLKLRVTGSKNASATDYYVAPDRVAVVATTTCTVETNAAFCSRLAKNCGAVSGTDNCGNARTVSSCGTCGFGQTCISNVCSADQSNMFTNPSFASGTTGWTTYFYPGAGTLSADATGQDGSASAKISIPSTYGGNVDWHAQVYQARTANGGAYTMSLSFQKTEGTSKRITAFCEEEGGAYTVYGSQQCTNSSGWTSCTVSCTPPNGKLTKFGISAAWDNVDVRLDSFTLVAGAAAPPPPSCTPESDAAFCSRLAKNCGSVTGTDNCGASRTVSSCGSCASPQTCGGGGTANVCGSSASATNLFSNASFASGTTGWTTYFASGCAGSLVTSSTAHDGDAKSAKIAIGTYSGTAWDAAQVFQIKTSNGSPYTLSAWFQKAESTSKKITVYCSENGGAYTLYGRTDCTNTTGWTKCTVTCSPPSGKSVKFGVGAGWNSVDTLIDAMTLTQ
jgi:hypothetical protein